MCTAFDFAPLFAENHSPDEAAITTTTTLRDLVNSVPKNRQVVSEGDDPSKVLGKNQPVKEALQFFPTTFFLLIRLRITLRTTKHGSVNPTN